MKHPAQDLLTVYRKYKKIFPRIILKLENTRN